MIRFITTLLLMFVTSLAHATYCPDGTLIASHPNRDCNYVPSTPAAAPTTSISDAHARAAARADAAAQATAQQRQQQSSSMSNASPSSAAMDDHSSSSFKALALSLPTAAFTPPMPIDASDCTNTTQRADAQLWNGFSQASAARSTDTCTLIKLHNAYLAECQYASAKQVKDLLTAKLLPGFKPADRPAFDMSENECRAWNTPAPPRLPEAVNLVAAAPAPAACVPTKHRKHSMRRHVKVCAK